MLASSPAPWRAAAAACTSLCARLAPMVAGLAIDGAGRGASRTAAAPAAAASEPPLPSSASWQQRFEGVSPGSVLRVDLPHTAVDLAVRVGEYEALELSSSGSSSAEIQLVAEQAPHDGHPGSSLVTVQQQTAQHTPNQQQQRQPLQLLAKGPSRFLSLEASTGGGSLAVEVIQEGSLRAQTRGGDISVPKVKAFDAHLNSGGGSISGAVTGVDVRLRSGGGLVHLKSLVGNRAAVESGGGAVAVGACYADWLRVESGGGPIRVTNMDCRGGEAELSSSGGPVTVDSLDGNLSIASAGGDVQVQLHENAGSVSVASGGGAIRLFLSPAMSGRLQLRGFGRLAADPSWIAAARQEGSGCLELALPLGAASGVPPGQQPAAGAAAGGGGGLPLSRLQRAQRGSGRTGELEAAGGLSAPGGRQAGSAGGASIVLDAGGSGAITLSERSWMEALRHKFA